MQRELDNIVLEAKRENISKKNSWFIPKRGHREYKDLGLRAHCLRKFRINVMFG